MSLNVLISANTSVTGGNPGENWLTNQSFRIAAGGNNMYAIANSNSNFVAIGVNARCLTSPDGITWTYQPGLAAAGFTVSTQGASLVWNGSKYLAISATRNCATSGDGITWTNQPDLASKWTAGRAQTLNWNGTQFLLMGQFSRTATSPDGITWTYRTPASLKTGESFESIAWNGSTYVAVSQNLSASSFSSCFTSSDGITWTDQTANFSSAFSSSGYVSHVKWNGSYFLATGASIRSALSSDGVNWSSNLNLVLQTGPLDVIGSNFISLSGVPSECKISTSANGIYYNNYSNSFKGAFGTGTGIYPESFAYNGTTAVAVGRFGLCATSPI